MVRKTRQKPENRQFYINTLIKFLFFISIMIRLSALVIPQDMWHDASFTYLFAEKDIGFIESSNDVHPPLFYLVAKGWQMVSVHEYWLRSLNIIFFVCFLYYANKYLKENTTDYARVVVLTIITFSPTLVYYSIEYRNYMLGMFLVMAQLYYFVRMLYHNKIRDDILFIISSVLMLYTHYYTAFALIVEYLFIIIWYTKKNIDQLKQFIIAIVPIIICSVPLMIYLLRTLPKLQAFWFEDITLKSFVSTIIYQFFSPEWVSGNIVLSLIIFLFLILILSFIIKGKDWFHLMFFLIPVGSVWLISQFSPMYHHRFFVFYSIGLFIFIGQILSRLMQDKRLKYVAFALFIFLVCILFAGYDSFRDSLPTELRDGSLALKQSINKDKVYVIIHRSTFSQTPFKYYLRDYNVYNLLVTGLNTKQRFTAGGSVIEDFELVILKQEPEIVCFDGCYFVIESSKYEKTEGDIIIYNTGGLMIYGRNTRMVSTEV